MAEVADCFRGGAYVLDERGRLRNDDAREAEVLRRRSPQRADAILETLRARPEGQELEALGEEIGRYRDPRWVEPLAALLSADSDLEQQRRAAFLLGVIGDPRAGDALLEALGRVHPTIKPAVLAALARLGDRRVEEPALDLLRNSSNLEVRRSAAQTLESGASEETLRALAAMLEEYPPLPVRIAIQGVLARHGFEGAKGFDLRELAENPRLRAQAEAEVESESDPLVRELRRSNLEASVKLGRMSPATKLLLSLWSLLRSIFFLFRIRS
jgi:HEAT repeat protein